MSKVSYVLKNPFRIIEILLSKLPWFHFVQGTKGYQCSISLSIWFRHKILNKGGNRKAYWPMSATSKVVCPENVYAGIDTCPGLMGGCYIQAIGKLVVDDFTQIGPNVVIITANHDLYDTREHIKGEVVIGKYCWIGAGAQILPNVVLGDFTIVGAGSVVTKSFPDGYCVIAGNPAKQIKQLEPNRCLRYTYSSNYNGYIKSERFESYRKKYLNI